MILCCSAHSMPWKTVQAFFDDLSFGCSFSRCSNILQIISNIGSQQTMFTKKTLFKISQNIESPRTRENRMDQTNTTTPQSTMRGRFLNEIKKPKCSLRVRFFEVIWIRISDPRSFRSSFYKGAGESTQIKDSLVPLRDVIRVILD